MATRALNLGDGVTVHNTSYDWAGATWSTTGANGSATYLSAGTGPESGMTKLITDVATINNLISPEFANILVLAGTSIEHIEVYKVDANSDTVVQSSIPGSVPADQADMAGIIEHWDGDNMTTLNCNTTGYDEYTIIGDQKCLVDTGADGSVVANRKKASEVTAVDSVSNTTPTLFEWNKPVGTTNGAGAVGYAICVWLNGDFSISDLETTLADYLA